MSEDKSDYEVGYGKTPRQTRWRKGQSGNPKGREKGHKGLKSDLEAALNAKNTLENKLTGKLVKGRNQELAIQRLVERAALGDLKAQALLFPMIMQVLGAEDRHKGPRKLSALDEEILAEVLGARLQEARESGTDAPGDRDGNPPTPDGEDEENEDFSNEQSDDDQAG
jgi:Family of unknown function (DUF5681)